MPQATARTGRMVAHNMVTTQFELDGFRVFARWEWCAHRSALAIDFRYDCAACKLFSAVISLC